MMLQIIRDLHSSAIVFAKYADENVVTIPMNDAGLGEMCGARSLPRQWFSTKKKREFN